MKPVVAFFLLLCQLASGEKTPQVQTLRNHDTRLDFDPQTGTYDVTVGAALAIDNAFAKVEGWTSSDPGYQRRIVEQDRDRFVIECSRPDAPTLLLEFTMRPAFVELRAGIKNTTTESIRIKKFEPLSGGIIFPGSTWNDIRTLNAPSGTGHTRVTRDVIRSSANNLLLTLKQDGARRSLVLGGLKTADFTKWAHTRSARSQVEGLGLRRVGYLDCGGPEAGVSPLRVVRGRPYTWTGATGPAGSVLFDDKMVEFEVTSLDPKKRYVLGFTWCDGDANGRFQSVLAGGQALVEKCAVPKEPATEIRILPAESYRDGLLSLSFVNETNAPNAVVSELWLWEADADFSLPTDPAEARVMAALEAYDPIGRQVEPGETYVPADSFYVDAAAVNPFEALEQYGVALREATGAKPNTYDFPTVCAWYAGVWKTPGAQDHPERSAYKINTTAGMVEEADKIKASGFLNYVRVAGRLVPDNYTVQNPQGWWDDEHWQMHGFYTAPYETSAKYGAGMHERGTLAFTYIQPVIQPLRFGRRICLDFREAHRDWFLNKDINREMDYSLPAVQEHVRSRFAALRGHIDGLMVDYADNLWVSSLYGHTPEQRLGKTSWEDVAAEQGADIVRLSDPRMTATAYYRAFFSSLREGLGPEARIHERNIQQPDNDLVLDLVDSQRTELDTDKISPELVSRSGLRWYKNRVVTAYDMDSKELYSAWKIGGWTGSDEDGRRMLLTMAYVAAGRLLLANSFRDLDAATLHDLSRTFPYPTEPRSARPVDAFVHDGWPRVYDFAVTPDWHQVTLFNNTMPTREESIAVPLAGETVDGALGLDPGAEYVVYDFWNDRLVGTFRGSDTLSQILRPGEARMLSVRKSEKRPQVISTNRHLMQGYYELSDVSWSGNRLTGMAKVVAGEPLRIVVACNGQDPVSASAEQAVSSVERIDGQPDLAILSIASQENRDVKWVMEFGE